MKKDIQKIIAYLMCMGMLITTGKSVNAQSVASADSLFLVELFKYANGGSWTNSWDTINDPVSSWYGIEVTDERVTGINLEKNNLYGVVSGNLSALTDLETLNLGNNILFYFVIDDFPSGLSTLHLDSLELRELPEVSEIPDNINVAGNYLTYGELDKFSGATTYVYAPQKLSETLSLCETGVLGCEIDLIINAGGLNTDYDWDREGSSISNLDSVYQISDIETTDFVTYSIGVSNPDYPLLTYNYTIELIEASDPFYLPSASTWTADVTIESIGGVSSVNDSVIIRDLGSGKFYISDITAGAYEGFGYAKNHAVNVGPTCVGNRVLSSESTELSFSAGGVIMWDQASQVLKVPWFDIRGGFYDTTTFSYNGSGIVFTSPEPYSSQWESSDLTLTWENTGISHNPYSLLQYSFDDENWYNLDDSYLNDWNDSYTWTFPDGFNGKSIRVRIIENNTQTVLGQSGRFVIKAGNPATISITDILDGATITGGQQFTLNFNGENLQNVADEIHLWYSANGEEYYRIAEDIETWEKSYDWQVPALDQSNIIIRATAAGSFSMEHNPSPYYDEVLVNIESENPISIDLTAPQGGDNLSFGNNPHDVTFNNANIPADASIVLEATTNGGEDWEVLEYAPSSPYTWEAPSVSSDITMLRLHSRNYPVGDTTEAFSLSAANPVGISLTNMLAGSALYVGEEVALDWNITNAPADTRVDLYISYDGGTTYEELTTYQSDTYDWTVLNNSTDEAVIKVKFNNRLYYSIDSTGTFSIQPPQPGINIKPSTDKEVVATNLLYITYSAFGITAADISYSVDNGTNWNEILSAKTDTGTNVWHAWTTPDIDEDDVWIRVMDTGNSNYGDTIKGITIQPSYLNILYPTSADTLTTGTLDTIKWETNITSEFTVDYRVNDGSWEQLYIGDSPYSFRVPDDWVESNKYKLRFTESGGLVDSSDYFTVVGNKDTLELTYPIGGEEWTTGEDVTISWNTSLTSGHYEVHYSNNIGNTFTFWFEGSISDGEAQVTIPTEWVASEQYRLLISGSDGLVDTSETFSVIEAIDTLELISPNGGEEWITGEEVTITWNTSLTSGQYEMHYSADSGNTFALWFDGDVTDGQAQVNVPVDWTPGSDYLLKISTDELADTSDATFSVVWPLPEFADLAGNIPNDTMNVNPEAILYNEQFEAMDTAEILNNSFLFEDVLPGSYYQKIDWWPEGDTTLAPTYYGNTALWSRAEPIVVEASYETITLPMVISRQEVTGIGADDGTEVRGTLMGDDGLKKATEDVILNNTLVYLLNPADSSLLFVKQTDESGAFSMGNISTGDYLFWMDIPLTDGYPFSVEDQYKEVVLDVIVNSDGTTNVEQNIVTAANELFSVGIQVYPVPAKDVLHISSPQSLEKVWIIDGTGKTLFIREPSKEKLSIDVSGFKSGMYIVLMQTNQQINKQTIIVTE